MRTLIAILTAVLIVLFCLTASADTLRVFPAGGELVLGHENHCGQSTRDDLRAIVAKVPLIMVTETSMTLITENFLERYYSKRCDEELVGVPPRKGSRDRTTRRFAWWNEPGVDATFLVILAEVPIRKRPVELVMIRRKKTEHPCYERWAGLAEVQ